MAVLVVEDEPLIRMLICELLEEVGIECLGACDAEHALMLLDRGGCRPNLIVSDFNLGRGLDGKALAREIQRRLPGSPTLFVTGNPEVFDDYHFQPWERLVAKPFAGAELIAAVSALKPSSAQQPEPAFEMTAIAVRDSAAHGAGGLRTSALRLG